MNALYCADEIFEMNEAMRYTKDAKRSDLKYVHPQSVVLVEVLTSTRHRREEGGRGL